MRDLLSRSTDLAQINAQEVFQFSFFGFFFSGSWMEEPIFYHILIYFVLAKAAQYPTHGAGCCRREWRDLNVDGAAACSA